MRIACRYYIISFPEHLSVWRLTFLYVTHVHKNSVPTSQRTQSAFIIGENRVILLREVIGIIYYGNRAKHIIALYNVCSKWYTSLPLDFELLNLRVLLTGTHVKGRWSHNCYRLCRLSHSESTAESRDYGRIKDVGGAGQEMASGTCCVFRWLSLRWLKLTA
jgi:hypothetical protein